MIGCAANPIERVTAGRANARAIDGARQVTLPGVGAFQLLSGEQAPNLPREGARASGRCAGITFDDYDLYRQAQQRLADREAFAAIPLLELAAAHLPKDRAILRPLALAYFDTGAVAAIPRPRHLERASGAVGA